MLQENYEAILILDLGLEMKMIGKSFLHREEKLKLISFLFSSIDGKENEETTSFKTKLRTFQKINWRRTLFRSLNKILKKKKKKERKKERKIVCVYIEEGFEKAINKNTQ